MSREPRSSPYCPEKPFEHTGISNGKDIMPEVNSVLSQMEEFATKVINGHWKGYTRKAGDRYREHGIGGSDLALSWRPGRSGRTEGRI